MLTFARTGESWKKDYRSWKFLKISFTQVIKFSELILKKCLLTIRGIDFEILRIGELKVKFRVLENQSKSWKSS